MKAKADASKVKGRESLAAETNVRMRSSSKK